MTLTFLYPIAAWLFALLPMVWWPMRRRPRWGHLALRVGVFACLIGALMQPSLVRHNAAGVQVFVLDQRASLGRDGQAAARAALARLMARAPAGARRVLIQLGGGSGASTVGTPHIVTDGSLSTALTRALDAIPLDTGGAVTLIASDRSTDGHWQDAVDALARRGIPLDTIALAPAPRPAFVGVVAVAPARVGEAIRLLATVEGDGGVHRLTVSSDGRVLTTSAPFRADGITRVALSVPAEHAGFLPLRVTLDGGRGFDTLAAVQDPLRLLYLGERQAGAARQLQNLIGRGFAVEARDPAAVDPARWPLVMLDDIPVARFPVAAQQRLTRAVARAGTGLFASGGMAAFGAGGYENTPLGAALPVVARQQDRQIRPSVALAIVIDSSGSMQGDRLDLAKQVARQTVRKLDGNDWVGVVEFYGARQWSVPMHHAADIPDVERSIGRMQAQGASVLFPALQEAFYGLKDLDARYKHILVISDGGVAEDRYQQLLRHIADNRINVSTVAVGGQVDDEKSMAEWARTGRGRFYSVPDEFNLVDLDFKQPQTKPEPGYRSGTVAVRAAAGTGVWGDLPAAGMPPLSGYVQTRARPEAETVLRTDGGDPILSSWPVGAGRVTALMTEPLGAGTASWRAWPGYGRWLARALALTARSRPDLDVTLDRRADSLRITVRRLGPASADAAAQTPDVAMLDAAGGTIRRVTGLGQRAPGLFVADVALPVEAAARIEVRDAGHVARAADAAGSDVRPETVMTAAMALPMAQVSAATGGWHRDDPVATPGPVQRAQGWTATDLWPWLALLALGLYLVEIAYRRWPTHGLRRRSAGNR